MEDAMTAKPAQITFRGIAHSDALEADISRHVTKLERFAPQIVGCRVLVEAPHRHHHDGLHYRVRVEVTIPGVEPIIVSHEPTPGIDPYLTVHEAFEAAERRVQDAVRLQRGAVKTPAAG
jgi:ribosome-associated translation inhibitor RaiA